MTDDRDEELNADERRAFGNLPMTLEPPAGLEDRVADQLRARGLLSRRGPRGWRPVLAAAAMFAAFAGGWLLHGWTSSGSAVPPAETRPRYMLLLYGAESAPGEEPRRVEEYRQWAISIAATGAHVSGEKLGDPQIDLGASADPSAPPLGFFIVSAADDRAAEALARSHPHLRHGGRILVKPIATH